MKHLRYVPRLGADLVAYAVKTGRWWTALVFVALAVTAGVAATASSAVPVTIYVLF